MNIYTQHRRKSVEKRRKRRMGLKNHSAFYSASFPAADWAAPVVNDYYYGYQPPAPVAWANSPNQYGHQPYGSEPMMQRTIPRSLDQISEEEDNHGTTTVAGHVTAGVEPEQKTDEQ